MTSEMLTKTLYLPLTRLLYLYLSMLQYYIHIVDHLHPQCNTVIFYCRSTPDLQLWIQKPKSRKSVLSELPQPACLANVLTYTAMVKVRKLHVYRCRPATIGSLTEKISDFLLKLSFCDSVQKTSSEKGLLIWRNSRKHLGMWSVVVHCCNFLATSSCRRNIAETQCSCNVRLQLKHSNTTGQCCSCHLTLSHHAWI